MRFLIQWLLAAVLLTSPSLAGVRHGVKAVGAGPTGQVELNTPALTQTGFPFQNFIKLMSSITASGTPASYPDYLDTNGYPNAAAIPGTLSLLQTLDLDPDLGNIDWRYGWTGTGWRRIQSNIGVDISSNSGCTVNGVPGFTGSTGATNVTISGTDCAFKWKFIGGTPATSTWVWITATYTGMADEYLVRDSDWTIYQAGGQNSYLTPEIIALYKSMNPYVIRMMDWAGVNNNPIVKYDWQPTLHSQSYNAARVEPTVWAGTTTGTSTAYSVNAPPGFPGLVRGATVQFMPHTANTTTTPTFTVGGTTPKNFVPFRANFALGVGAVAANTISTAVYDDVLDKWLFVAAPFATSSGNAVPLEVRVALANLVNAHLWDNTSILYDQASVVQHNTVIKNLLNPWLNYHQEVSNEVWNKGNGQTGWSIAFMQAIGVTPTATGQREYNGTYGLKTAQHTTWARSVWGSDPRYVGVMAHWRSEDSTAMETYRYLGTDLNGTTYPAYAAAGFPNYNGAGGTTTPISYVQGPNNNGVDSYATYYQGANASDPTSQYTTPLNIGGPNTGPNTGLLGAADDFDGGTAPGIASAIAYMDWDIRQGIKIGCYGSGVCSGVTVSSSGDAVFTKAANFLANNDIVAFNTTGTFDPNIVAGKNYYAVSVSGSTWKIANTPNGTPITVSGASTGTITFGAAGDGNHGGGSTLLDYTSGASGSGPARGVYANYNNLATTYGLRVMGYEGGYGAAFMTQARCTATGTPSAYCGVGGKIDNLVQYYKTTVEFQQLVKDQFDQFMSYSRSRNPTWYGVVADPNRYTANAFGEGANWAFLIPSLFTPNTYLKSYDAMKNYHYPFLLKRDLDPASNDNDPMWLEKAA